jgi:GT2 family glycosyltransferase/glycosyltransferase involved in cell wall biosynthesis
VTEPSLANAYKPVVHSERPAPPVKQSVVCITGAHRSGTSMLARLLHICGLFLGREDDLMPAAADNPKGFWEHLGFVRLNDEILNTIGCAWDLPPKLSESFDSPNLASARVKAQLLLDQFSDSPPWGWKDPRCSLTLPFWRSVVPGLRVIIIVRHPLEAAYSLHRRNGTSYSFGLRLWEIYNRHLLTHASPEQRLITSYQALFERPEEELERLVSFAGLKNDAIAEAAATIARDHRHTSFTIDQLIDAGADREVVDLYCKLVEATTHDASRSRKMKAKTRGSQQSDTESSEKQDPLAGTSHSLNFAIVESETVRRELAQRRGAEIENAEKTRQLQARIETLTQELSGNAQRAALEIGRRDGRITELQTAYAHLDQLLRREQEGRDKLLAQLERERELIANLREREQTTRAQLEDLRRREQANAEEVKQLRANLEEVRKRFAETNHLLRSYSIRLEDREKENFSLIQRLRKQLQVTRRLTRLLDEAGRASELLQHSRRWVLGNLAGWLSAKIAGKKPPGFGHLDRTIEKYKAWRTATPEVEHLDDAIANLRLRESPVAPTSVDSFTPSQIPPSIQPFPAAPVEPIEFPVHESVAVSIIIPVFNQLRFTQACLGSIQQHAGSIQFEVIVVDDCSTDSTRECISSLPGVRYLRNESNQGFIASCNRGAGVARGEYLVFLNNDTTVSPGWLENLLETFNLKPEAGLVGSKLVYPDGRLQEAGGIIWRDGSGWNRGKFQDAGRPEYNYLREVHYCSAASIMIPKSLFDQVGGFDLKYAPAYYEDTDLAFKVAQTGRKVFYQPLSVVTHYEGITSGTDLSAGAKRYQEVNRKTFVENWTTVLAALPENGDLASYYTPAPGKKRILVIDHHLPMPDRDSGSVRMFNLLRTLQGLGHEVTFLPDNLADISPYGDALRKHGIAVLRHPYIKSIREYLRTEGHGYDIIILSRCDFARKHVADVRAFAPKSRLIFDTVDLHFLREQRASAITNQPSDREIAREKRQIELDLVEEADQTWVVSPVERDIILSSHPQSSVEVVSNIVELPGSVTPFADRRDILFIGSFQHPPNTDGVLFFSREILPLVQEQMSGLRFYIIGDKAPPEVVALSSEQVIVTGYQPDVSIYFNTIKLSVAPLRYGAGVKGKINQSMGFGVPVVATPIAAEGMSLVNGEEIIIAEEPHDFAQSLVQLYSDQELWERLSHNALKKAGELFSLSAARRKLEVLLGDDHRNGPSPSSAASNLSYDTESIALPR